MFFQHSGLRVLTPIVALLATIPIGLSAQDGRGGEQDPFLLPDIVVTATSTPFSRTLLPTSVTILSGATLREQGIRNVADAVRLAAGITVLRAGGEGAQTSIFMRGGENDYVKILIDGVPVNQAGGAVDLADLSTAQVERIEIVRGPASILYGSDAVSGVVQIFTRRGRGAPSLDIALTGGQGARAEGEERYGVMDLEATLSGSSDALSYAIGGSHSSSDGLYTLNNERGQSTANARMAWDAGGSTAVSLSTRFSDGVFHFPTDGAGNPVDANAFLDRRLLTVATSAAHRFGSTLTAYLDIGRSSTELKVIDEPDTDSEEDFSHSTSEESRITADLRLRGAIASGTLTVGTGYERLAGRTVAESFSSSWGASSAESDSERTNHALYAEYIGAPLGGVNLTLGGRIDRNETFGTFETFRLGFSHTVGASTRLRGMVGKAFREPTFGENFGSGYGDIGNPNLLPERTRSWEMGVEQSVGSVLITATWFDQRFEDLIQYFFDGDNPTNPNYVNVGSAKAVGLELTAESTFGALALAGTYTLLSTEVLDPGASGGITFVQGEPLLRRPANSGSVTGRWGLSGGSISGTMHFVGEREDGDFTSWPYERATLASYSTFDLSGEHTLPVSSAVETRAFFRIENLLGAEYDGILGFRGTGRVARIGVRLGLGG